MSKILQACVISLSFCLIACAPDAPPPGAPLSIEPPVLDALAERNSKTRAAAPVIVMLGDSLTAGFGLAPDEALPERTEAELAEAGLATTFVNAGVSGDTTANGLARYDWSVASADPDLLIVALGANDYLMGASSELARDNLAQILTRAATDGVPAVLAGLVPRSDAPEGSRDAAFADLYPDLATAFDIPLFPALLDGVSNNPALLQTDGLHPTAEGVEMMAQRLAEFLDPYLRERSLDQMAE